MPKLKQHDFELWNLFVEVLGSRCYGCGKSGVPLERGHLQPHAHDGAGTFDNLIPLCRPCNASNRDGVTADTRPEGWQDIFGKRFLSECLGVVPELSHTTGIPVRPLKTDTNGLEVTQDIGSLSWTNFRFRPSKLLFPTQKQVDPLKPMSDREAADLIERTLDYAEQHPAKLVTPPLEARQGKLRNLAKIHGADKFKLAVKEFLEQQPWPERHTDPWAYFCANFIRYLNKAKLRKRAEAEQRERQHESHAADRWKRYLWVAAVPDWPDMTDADREFIATAKRLVDQPVRELSDEDMGFATDICQRQRNYEAGVIRNRRDKSLKRGERSIKILKLLDNPDPEFAERIKHFVAWILGAKTFNEEDSYESHWSELEQELENALDRRESNRAGVHQAVNDPDADELKQFLQEGNW